MKNWSQYLKNALENSKKIWLIIWRKVTRKDSKMKLKLNQESPEQVIAKNILSFFDVQEYKTITQFALQDIDLSDDVSASKTNIDLENYPYMV